MSVRHNPPLPSASLGRAKELRSTATDAERALWLHLRARRCAGLKFRRQHPVPPYVVDFMCVEAKLIVELDGSQHSDAIDEARTRFLVAKGFKVCRFWNNDVLDAADAVLEVILDAISKPNPLPNPSPAGRGA